MKKIKFLSLFVFLFPLFSFSNSTAWANVANKHIENSTKTKDVKKNKKLQKSSKKKNKTKGSLQIDLESGGAFLGYNHIRVPKKGTLISTSKNLKGDPAIFFRLRLTYNINKNHHLEFLWAPFSLDLQITPQENISFQNKIFSQGIPLDINYTFNSYRLGYRYDFLSREKIEMGIGLTFKIREAYIELSSKEGNSKESDLGFVPLIRIRLLWKFHPYVSFLWEGDALGAPQGRAEDFLFAFLFRLSPKIWSKFGYRILEGGANVDSVYNYTLVHYLVFGVNFRF